MSKIPFYIGNFIAMFTPGGVYRARVRGWTNTTLYLPRISILIKKLYNEKVHNVKFIRQINLNRFVCLINDKYYVKVFRNITMQRLREHKFLVDFVRSRLNIEIPEMRLENHIPMYACEKISGYRIIDFDPETILKNEEKIKKQLADIISQIQKIDLDSIPDYNRFWYGLQPERQPEKPVTDKNAKPVLAHFDLNESNLFFDKDMNITGVIDWDTLSIAKNPETDMNVFNLFWTSFIRGIKKRLANNQK